MRIRPAPQTVACAALALLTSLGACSAIVDSDAAKLGALPIACETGRSVNCPCPDGSTSTQTCNKLARYDVCACKGQGQAGRSGASGGAVAGRGNAAGSTASGRLAAGAASH